MEDDLDVVAGFSRAESSEVIGLAPTVKPTPGTPRRGQAATLDPFLSIDDAENVAVRILEPGGSYVAADVHIAFTFHLW